MTTIGADELHTGDRINGYPVVETHRRPNDPERIIRYKVRINETTTTQHARHADELIEIDERHHDIHIVLNDAELHAAGLRIATMIGFADTGMVRDNDAWPAVLRKFGVAVQNTQQAEKNRHL